jgi:hypothetical protein
MIACFGFGMLFFLKPSSSAVDRVPSFRLGLLLTWAVFGQAKRFKHLRIETLSECQTWRMKTGELQIPPAASG